MRTLVPHNFPTGSQACGKLQCTKAMTAGRFWDEEGSYTRSKGSYPHLTTYACPTEVVNVQPRRLLPGREPGRLC
jgi:hypothetical protein